MKNIKKILLIAFMAIPSALFAEEGATLLLKIGQTVAFAFSSRPVVKTGEQLMMQSTNQTVIYDYSEVQRIELGEISTTGIRNVEKEKPAIIFKLTNEGIEVSGLDYGESISVFTVNGTKVANTKSKAKGSKIRLSLPVKGVYVVSTSSGINYKFIRK